MCQLPYLSSQAISTLGLIDALEITNGSETHPVLPGDVSYTSYGNIRHFERLQVRLRLIVPDLHLTIATIVSCDPSTVQVV